MVVNRAVFQSNSYRHPKVSSLLPVSWSTRLYRIDAWVRVMKRLCWPLKCPCVSKQDEVVAKVDSTKEVAKKPRWVSAAPFEKYTEARAGMIGKSEKRAHGTMWNCYIHTSGRSNHMIKTGCLIWDFVGAFLRLRARLKTVNCSLKCADERLDLLFSSNYLQTNIDPSHSPSCLQGWASLWEAAAAGSGASWFWRAHWAPSSREEGVRKGWQR